jgi:histidinol dehydrogenase
VILDSDEKVLAGIKADGTIEWGVGVPTPIIEYIEQTVTELHIENKVDKEEGKSLINSDFAESQSSVENPEFLTVITDYEDKILHGIKSDGTIFISGDLENQGNVTIEGNVNTSSLEIESGDNPEYIQVTTDGEDKIVMGIKNNGAVYIPILENDSID